MKQNFRDGQSTIYAPNTLLKSTSIANKTYVNCPQLELIIASAALIFQATQKARSRPLKNTAHDKYIVLEIQHNEFYDNEKSLSADAHNSL